MIRQISQRPLHGPSFGKLRIYRFALSLIKGRPAIAQ